MKKQKKKEDGKKNDQNKPSLSLIPGEAIWACGQALSHGAKVYGRYNFRKGLSHSRLLDSALRHITQRLMGEEIDKDSGNLHIWNAMASLAMYEWMRVNRPDLNDLYEYPKKKGLKNASNNKRTKSRGGRR